MTKRTINGGFIILLIFTVLVAVGIFLMQRYNGIANAEAAILASVNIIDKTVEDQKSQTSRLLESTESLKDTTEYSNLSIKKVSLQKAPESFFKDDASFQKNLSAYLDAVAKNTELSKDDTVSSILGQIQGDAADLRSEKLAYNAAIDAYNKKKNARPRFYGQLLGFTDYQKFSNIPTPLDATSPNDTNTEDQNQNPDINSFN